MPFILISSHHKKNNIFFKYKIYFHKIVLQRDMNATIFFIMQVYNSFAQKLCLCTNSCENGHKKNNTVIN